MARHAMLATLVLAACATLACVSGFELASGSEFQLDLSSPYFRFASLDARALAEITYPTETTPEALEKILHPTPMMNSLEKVDMPGKEYTDEEAKILWEKHLLQYGNKHYTDQENEQRFTIFKKNLVKVSEQNFLHGGGFSYKSAFADLTTKEFSKMKGLLFKPKEIIEENKVDLKKAAVQEREKAYRDWLGFRQMFGETRHNPYRTPYNETARGKAKVARWRKIKAARLAAKAKKAELDKKEAERLAALRIKQQGMRDEKHAKIAAAIAATAARKAAAKAAAEQKKAQVLKNQAERRAAKAALKAAKAAKAAAKPVPKTTLPVVPVKPATPTPQIIKVSGKAPLPIVAPVVPAAPVAAAPTVAKTLFELEAEVDSDALDADQLEESALAADELQAEVDALSDMDASTEVTSEVKLDADAEAEIDLGVDESDEMVMLELDSELMSWLGSEASAEAESESEAEEQQSIFARFETREPVEADVYTPPGEEPVLSPVIVSSSSTRVANAQRASAAGAQNFEFPGETSIYVPNAPTAVVPDAPSAATAAASSTPTVQPLNSTSAATSGALNATTVEALVAAILNPAMDETFKQTAATRRVAANKNIIDIDWRTKGVLSPLKSQGQCGSCWAQSAVSVVESAIAIKKNSSAFPLSVQQVVSCDTQDSGCDGGNPITALAYLSNWAISPALEYPYSEDMFRVGGPAPLCNTTRGKSGFPYVESSKTYEKDEVKIAQALQRGPLTALVDASKWQFYDGSKIVYPASGCANTVDKLDHSVVIVGLGSLANGERYWIVRNHWDSTWGAGGYIFLAYGSNTCGVALQATEVVLSEKAFLL